MALACAASGAIILRPLIPLAIALQAGIAMGVWLPGHMAPAAALLLAAAAGVIFLVSARRSGGLMPLLLIAAAGYLSIQPWLGRKLPEGHIAHFAGQGVYQLVGALADDPLAGDNRTQFTLQVIRLERGEAIPACGKIRISTIGEMGPLRRGDLVHATGRISRVRGFCNPQGFDYERHMALQGVHARLYARADLVRVEPAPPPDWHARLDRLRAELAERMGAAMPDFPLRAVQLLKLLTIGRREGLDPALQESFSRAGVSHVLAISGLHIGMVAFAALTLFSWLLGRVPALLRCGWVRRSAAALTLLPVIGYGLLAGLSPSTQRAMVMGAAFLLTFWVGRAREWLNLLALAALVILVFSPPALISISFQLSFAAVMAILVGMRRLPLPVGGTADSLSRRVMLWGLSSTAVTLLATWGTAPLVMRYFNQFSWVGPLSNLLVVPMVGFFILPAGLLGVACLPFSSALAGLCWKAAALALQPMIGWVETIAGWGWAAAVTVTPTVPEIVLFYLFSALLCMWRQRTLRIIGLAGLLLAGGADVAYWCKRRFNAGQISITAIDVGQGSANLLQLPGGSIVLVDGGGFSDQSTFDVGRSVVAPLLWSNRIRTIDLLILTHPNSDHLNGLIFILEHFKVKQVWSNHEEVPTLGFNHWREAIERHAIEHPPWDRVPRQAALGEAQLTVLGPGPDFLERRVDEPWRDTNNNSLVVRMAWRKISFLFTGDIMAAAEKELLAHHAPELLRSTVLIVPHHGSKNSGTTSFLQAVGAREQIIPVGWQNPFKFPHPPLLQRLSQNGRIWRTDRCGAVTIRSNGNDYRVETCREDATDPGGRADSLEE